MSVACFISLVVTSMTKTFDIYFIYSDLSRTENEKRENVNRHLKNSFI